MTHKGIFTVIGPDGMPELDFEGKMTVYTDYTMALEGAIAISRLLPNQEFHVWRRIGPTIHTTASTHVGGEGD